MYKRKEKKNRSYLCKKVIEANEDNCDRKVEGRTRFKGIAKGIFGISTHILFINY